MPVELVDHPHQLLELIQVEPGDREVVLTCRVAVMQRHEESLPQYPHLGSTDDERSLLGLFHGQSLA